MEQKEKQEFVSMIRVEVRESEDHISRKFGVLWENINDKFALILEAFDGVHKRLDEHEELFKAMFAKLDKKADVEKLDLLDRRVTKLEQKRPRPLRSG